MERGGREEGRIRGGGRREEGRESEESFPLPPILPLPPPPPIPFLYIIIFDLLFFLGEVSMAYLVQIRLRVFFPPRMLFEVNLSTPPLLFLFYYFVRVGVVRGRLSGGD